MAQHDLDVANGSGATVRADMNLALVALGTTMKGASAPSAAAAGMQWVEDDNPSSTRWTLRMYDGTDWIALGVLDATNNRFEPAHNEAGIVAFFGASSAPTGWLKANGAAVSRTTYAALFTAISTIFGTGDGSTTFNLPDLRGEFLRGWDDSRGVDTARSFGSAQAEAVNTDGVSLREASATWAASGSGVGSSLAYFSNSNISAYGTNRTVAGGSENRPRNIALLACIKY